MPSLQSEVTWEEALQEFLLHVRATRSKSTCTFYGGQLRVLAAWAEKEGIAFSSFGKRHLDRFLIARAESGSKPTTVHHGAMCAKTFYRWCASNDLLDRSPLAEYRVRKAPLPPRRMPSTEDIRKFVSALAEYWDPRKNPNCRFMTTPARSFHRNRNTAIYLGALSTACRISELLSLKLDDYVVGERRLLLRETKGREPRTVPVSLPFEDALAAWLRTRRKIMAGREDEGWLFFSETGGRIDANKFIRGIGPLSEFAGCSVRLQMHDLRRYAINKYARKNLLAAQEIAGHKDARTTHGYTKSDPEWLRDMVDEVDVLGKVLISKRELRRERVV